MISSVANPTIRRVRRLRKQLWRERQALFFVEGHHAVAGALRGGRCPAEVFHTATGKRLRADLLGEAKRCGARLYEISPSVMAHLTSVATAPDVLAVAPIREGGIDALAGGTAVLLSPVHDPATAGSIMASAAAAGCRSAVAGPGTTDLYDAKTVRAAQGAHFHLAVVRGVAPADAIAACRAGDRRVVALGTDGPPPWDVDLRRTGLFVIGDNDAGAGDADARVSVPGAAVTPSLSARAAVLLYEWVRQGGSTV